MAVRKRKSAPKLSWGHVSERLDEQGAWGVETYDDDGGVELKLFRGANARERAVQFAKIKFEKFEVIDAAKLVKRGYPAPDWL